MGCSLRYCFSRTFSLGLFSFGVFSLGLFSWRHVQLDRLFFVLEHAIELLEEDVGVLRLEDEGGAEADGALAAAAAVDAGSPELGQK